MYERFYALSTHYLAIEIRRSGGDEEGRCKVFVSKALNDKLMEMDLWGFQERAGAHHSFCRSFSGFARGFTIILLTLS